MTKALRVRTLILLLRNELQSLPGNLPSWLGKTFLHHRQLLFQRSDVENGTRNDEGWSHNKYYLGNCFSIYVTIFRVRKISL